MAPLEMGIYNNVLTLFRNRAPKLLPIQNEASVKIPPASTFLELSLPRLLTSKEVFNHLRQGQKKKKPVSYS
jgi:hypothetical protein